MADSARTIINNTLSEYGLDTAFADDGQALADWAWDRFLETGDANVVMIELRSQQAFRNRFPAYEQLAKDGRAISPQEYVQYERTVYGLFQQYGIPEGVFGPDSITSMLLNDVSATEVSERLAINAEAMFTAPQEVRDALFENYGLTEGGLLAYYMDPENALPTLRQQYVSAQIKGAAAERGFAMDRAESERLASLGYTYAQTREAAERAASVTGLTRGTNAVRPNDVFMSQMGDTGALSRVRREVASRLARTQGGGGASATNDGVTGLAASSSL